MERAYTKDEVARIIRRAQTKTTGDTVPHDELVRMASELGLDPAAVAAAAEEEALERSSRDERARKLQRRRDGFVQHLWAYAIVIGFLLVLDIMTRGPFWFQWPALGWGIGIAFHFRSAYFPSAEEIREND